MAPVDAFDGGQALRADMLCTFAGCVGLMATRNEPATHIGLTMLLFISLAISLTA
nr:hypothetical protein [Mycobacterium uberis]